jgi:pyrroline-5-carboxylate reductase
MRLKRPLGLIGAGKMGEALLKGLLCSRHFTANRILVSDRDSARINFIKREYGVIIGETNQDLLKEVDTCVLAVKPQDVDGVLDDVREGVSGTALLISIVAGVTVETIQSRVGPKVKVIRAMPNAPALVGMGATGLFFGKSVSRSEGGIARSIFDCVGRTVIVTNEDHLNIVTGLSGSGPAYVFLFLEALIDAGVYLGLSREVSTTLSLQTILGSSEMASKSERPIPLLKEMITSPGGTTAVGLRALEEGKLRSAIISAVEGATKRSRELAK